MARLERLLPVQIGQAGGHHPGFAARLAAGQEQGGQA